MITGNRVKPSTEPTCNRGSKQVKITVDQGLAASFQKACAASKVSMASELTKFMAEYTNTFWTKRKPIPDYSTKRQRRTAIRKVIMQLEQIRDAEVEYQDRIPDNLQGSIVFESAEEFVAALEEAIDALVSITSR